MYVFISIYFIYVCKLFKNNRKYGISFVNMRKYEFFIKKNLLVILRSKQFNLYVIIEIQRGLLVRVYYIVYKYMMKNDIVFFG